VLRFQPGSCCGPLNFDTMQRFGQVGKLAMGALDLDASLYRLLKADSDAALHL
tara:strand:+ start:118468 stop:118626 length:159 start_codon:yes stop_codon:yes gene_type:complete